MKLYQSGAGALEILPGSEWVHITRRMLAPLGAVGAALAFCLVLVLLFGAAPAGSRPAAAALEGAPSEAVEPLPAWLMEAAPETGATAPRPAGFLPAEVDPGWWAEVQAKLEAESYQIAPAGKRSHQAYNEANKLVITFAPDSFSLTPAESEEWPDGEGVAEHLPAWQWGLRLTGYSHGEDVQVAPSVTRVAASGNRIEYQRGGSGSTLITEWYVNNKRGLEQGFTLWAAPKSRGADTTELTLVMAVVGDLAPSLVDGGLGLVFAPAGHLNAGPVLTFDHLAVEDAGGRTLPARFAVGEDGTSVEVRMESAGAIFPITVDPLAAPAEWTASGDAPSAQFGRALGAAGDVNGDGYGDVVAGASGADGSRGRVYVYLGSASGLSRTPVFSATGEELSDYFGVSAGSAGDVNGDGYDDIIVGATGYGNANGRIYVYLGGAGGLQGSAVFTATGQNNNDLLGHSVGTAGDTNGDGYADIIATASGYGSRRGRVYVYQGDAGGVQSTPVFSATGEVANGRLGWSAGTAGDVNGDGYADIIGGAPYYGNRGRVYVHLGSAAGPEATAVFTATGEMAGSELGIAVSTAGDVDGDGYTDIMVGAKGHDGRKGRAYIYGGGPSGLATTAVFSITGGAEGSYLGGAVGTAGDVNGDGYADVVVGAYGYSGGTGRAYVYLGGAAEISATPIYVVTGESAGDRFGETVGTVGDVNGDGYADLGTGASGVLGNTGRGYVYVGGASKMSSTPVFSATGEAADNGYGRSVGTAGDVNGDGYADLAVGADEYEKWTGRAYVYLGGPAGLSVSPAFTATGEVKGDSFGRSVESAGDVNGDGYADLAVSAPGRNWGRAYVYLGGPGGLTPVPAFTATGETVGAAGDVNGDGYADLAVGNGYLGRVYVYLGGPAGLSATQVISVNSGGNDGWFGRSLGLAGDVNGDGYADLAVGAYRHNSYTGRVYVYQGGPGGLTASPAFSATGEAPYHRFGLSLGTAGDVNDDGYADLAVGAYGYGSNSGRAYVYLGGPGGLAASPAFSATGEATSNYFGWLVAEAGDVNGDGFADLAVGALLYNGGRGRVYVFAGGPDGLSSTAVFSATGEKTGEGFGNSAGTAGDVDGDGFADLAVGAYAYKGGTGRAFVYGVPVGRPAFARGLTPGLVPTPIHPWSTSQGSTEFAVQARAVNPYGRGRVKGEVEACPAGVAFGDVSCARRRSATWDDVMTGGTTVTLNVAVDGLEAGTLYRWRSRVLYAPFGVTQANITPPPNPKHGPWRRFLGQAQEADLRIGLVYALSVSVSGDGSVTGAPVGISCGIDCTENIREGGQVTLLPLERAHTTFVGWAGACSGNSSCLVTMDGTKHVAAEFAVSQYDLNVLPTGSGSGTVTSSPEGIDCGSECTGRYFYSTPVTLTAAADIGSTFTAWGGACSGSDECVVLVEESKVVSVEFTLKEYPLTVTVAGVGNGIVKSIPGGIDCGVDCTESYGHGTQVTLMAEYSPGSTFTGWGGACSGLGSCAVAMDGAKTVSAEFAEGSGPQPTAALTMTVSVDGVGTVTSIPEGIQCGSDCIQTYVKGAAVTLAAAADDDYIFEGWGGACSGSGTCEVTMDAPMNVVATFSVKASVGLSTTVILTVEPTEISRGETISLAAVVMDISGDGGLTGTLTGVCPLSGMVEFFANDQMVGSVRMIVGCRAVIVLEDVLAPGQYILVAKYTGDALSQPSTSEAVTITVADVGNRVYLPALRKNSVTSKRNQVRSGQQRILYLPAVTR